ncbi:MAG: Hsp20/alpha crystallin family protein [Bacteroidales bacterium]|nr:Hsp20/alpha crystallin family protein [Bacteroidales bacterium]MDD2204259.1 Hsp20/alpha crystallin family protein [Bacteroidales bacterium]MDD3153118.1 Hsp20/alpha crystallin family protein [Bacteroidales bacterium]MDD3913569.1 Hsp20/alpha crystallin family protein [Bacteroidales bacterium]MDD4633663.1 Hsp20/alpha crystallin family protein [Bacteroidales bacterium]
MKLVRFNEPVTFSDLFEDFFNTGLVQQTNKKMSVPAVNIVDNEKDYVIEVAVPGKQKEDFNINIDNDVLTISTETKAEKCDTKKNYTRQEFCYCSFSRSFNLTDDIDRDKIEAKYDNGMLLVTLPKKEVVTSDKCKQIDIK